MIKEFKSMIAEGKWKGTEEELHDYLLYIKKYKPELFNNVKRNKDIKKLLKKFEAIDEKKKKNKDDEEWSGLGYDSFESIEESTYKLLPGSTTDDLDELDATLSRYGIKGKPDFSKLTYTISKMKLPFSKARHLDMLMKKLKTKKIHEVKNINEGSGWANQKAMKKSDVAKILKTDLGIILSGGKPKGGYRGDTGEIFSWGDRNPKSGLTYTIEVHAIEDILKELP